MPPVIFESRDIVGDGRYVQEVRISKFQPSASLPGGLRYSLCLLEVKTGDVILLYDVHRGKPDHRHLRGVESSYEFQNLDALLDDFLHEVALVLEGKL
jgi:hypothetical protein